ncbi:MAG: hypothetical protein JXA99_05750 [Candidatus Lokiarchaeota archaeon]|nr:hypothetical protein [Candidatus Lokiarchaeota archaeon]
MNNTEDNEEYELNKIRMQKMRSIMEAKKRAEQTQQQTVSIYDKIDYVLKIVLMPEAFNHLSTIKKTEPNVYQSIFNELVGQDIVNNIDYLITLIQKQGGVARRIPLDVIILLERQVKGIKSKIQVKRGDDMMDLGSYLKKD